MIPIDIQVSRSKVKVKGQAYSSYVGEGGHLCLTNSYICFGDARHHDSINQKKSVKFKTGKIIIKLHVYISEKLLKK